MRSGRGEHRGPLSGEYTYRSCNSHLRHSYLLPMAPTQSREIVSGRTHARSPYMEFAKLRSSAKYNLATSGMAGLPLAELDISLHHPEVNPPAGDGNQPLLPAPA